MAETEPTGSATGPFHTPTWVRQRAGEHDQEAGPVLPRQPAPAPSRAAPTTPPVPHRASWGGHSDTGVLGGLVAGLAALLTVVGLVIAAVLRSPASLVLPGVAAAAFFLVRNQIGSGSGVRTTLERSLLEVATPHGPRRFDLAVPEIGVAMSDSVDDPKWQLILDDQQGKPVVLTRQHVPPDEVAPIVRHYRAIAESRAKNQAFRLEY